MDFTDPHGNCPPSRPWPDRSASILRRTPKCRCATVTFVDGDVDVASAAALIGDSTRAAFLLALSETGALPASELAARAEVSAPTASAHLARLVDGGLVAAERRGRHRYFSLADPAVATALEALSVIAPTHPVRSL